MALHDIVLLLKLESSVSIYLDNTPSIASYIVALTLLGINDKDIYTELNLITTDEHTYERPEITTDVTVEGDKVKYENISGMAAGNEMKRKQDSTAEGDNSECERVS